MSKPYTIAECILSAEFQSKLKNMNREFDSLQPDGDTPANGYLSLNARAALVTKHLGPFGFSLRQDIIDYPVGSVVYTTLLVMSEQGYIPWTSRYGSASDSLRADGDIAQAGISAWRKILVALGLSNTSESKAVSDADERAAMLVAITGYMSQRNVSAVQTLVGVLRSVHSSFDMTMDQVKGQQLTDLTHAQIAKLFYTINQISESGSANNAPAVAIQESKDEKNDGF